MTTYIDKWGKFDVEIPHCRDCDEEAVVLFPGSDGVSCDLFSLTRPTAGYGYCMEHARSHGWPNHIPHERETRLA